MGKDAQELFEASHKDLKRNVEELIFIANLRNANDPLVSLEQVRHTLDNLSFKVSVLSVIKTGKSTFLNAILGAGFLHTGTLPATARVISLHHDPNEKEGVLEYRDKEIARGYSEISKHIENSNKIARESGNVNNFEMKLRTNFPYFEEKEIQIPGLIINDTPGADEAGLDSLSGLISTIMLDSSVIIYLLNYNSIGKQVDVDILTELLSVQPGILMHSAQRMFFLINQIDRKGVNSISLDEAIDSVATILRQILPPTVSGKDWVPRDHIIPLSAFQGYVNRSIRKGCMSDTELESLKEALDPSNFCEGDLDDLRARCKKPSFAEKSNFFVTEDKIFTHLYENSGMIVLLTQAPIIRRICQRLLNHVLTTKSALYNDTQYQRRISQLEDELAKIVKGFQDAISGLPDALSTFLTNWQHNEFKSLSLEAEFVLKNAFSAEHVPAAGFLGRMAKRIQHLVIQDLETIEHFNLINSVVCATLNQLIEKFLNNLKADSIVTLGELCEHFSKKMEPVLKKITKRIGNALEVSMETIFISFDPDIIVEQLEEEWAIQTGKSSGVSKAAINSSSKNVTLEHNKISLTSQKRRTKGRCGTNLMDFSVPEGFEHPLVSDEGRHLYDKAKLEKAWLKKSREKCFELSTLASRSLRSIINGLVNQSLTKVDAMINEYKKLIHINRTKALEGENERQRLLEEATKQEKVLVDILESLDKFKSQVLELHDMSVPPDEQMLDTGMMRLFSPATSLVPPKSPEMQPNERRATNLADLKKELQIWDPQANDKQREGLLSLLMQAMNKVDFNNKTDQDSSDTASILTDDGW